MPNTPTTNHKRVPIHLAGAEAPGDEARDLTKRFDALCAELVAIEYWDWLDRTGTSVHDLEEEVRELRWTRREAVTSEIQVLFAQQAGYFRSD